jgi:hypothetical protein
MARKNRVGLNGFPDVQLGPQPKPVKGTRGGRGVTPPA